MNLVTLTGRIVTPPEFKEGTRPDGSPWVRAYFRFAVYRPLSKKRREGARAKGTRTADFFHVVVLGDPRDAAAFVRSRAAEGGLEVGTPLEIVGELEQQILGEFRQRTVGELRQQEGRLPEGNAPETGAARIAPEAVVIRARRIQYGQYDRSRQGGRTWSPDPEGRDRREERGSHEGRDRREERDPGDRDGEDAGTSRGEVSYGWAGIRNPFEDDPGDGSDVSEDGGPDGFGDPPSEGFGGGRPAGVEEWEDRTVLNVSGP